MQASSSDWTSRFIAIATAQADGDGAHDLNHLHRVWRVAAALLAEYPQADRLVVQAACYLHDLVNLPKNHPERTQASRMAAELAARMLAEADFPADRLPGVCHAIEAHSFSAGIAPRTIEARIVQDADRLDALGAVGLARLFYTAGRMGSAFAHPSDPLGHTRELDDQRYALDHIERKLAGLPASMQTEAARRLGQQRLEWLRGFRDTFVAEWGQSAPAQGMAD
ncbi:HD domain-containing protein [Bordetella genomosp. 13]|uniref:Hydrolase n=1 Tax=Bordetella genomosp. 13 TaxID=463040 RepID=A0A1W6ZAP0_9BORD|nr:HD domain-containing protein [Bordetella genomosp. 13]ARP94466.1 hydrolase [Bordetella genomosp. 13]